MKRMGGFIMKLSIATTGIATMCCLTTACGKEADLMQVDTTTIPNATSSIVTTAPITSTAPIVTSTQQMSVDIPLTDDVIIDTTINEDIVIETYPSEEKITTEIGTTTAPKVTTTTQKPVVNTTTKAPVVTTTKKPTTVTTTKTKKPTVTTTTKKATTTTKKVTTTTKTTTTKKVTTTTRTIKITQDDVDRLVDELQEYSNSKETDAKTDENFNAFLVEEYGSVENWYAYRVSTKTPSNSSWGFPVTIWKEYDTYEVACQLVKEAIDCWYEDCPDSHIVLYAQWCPNGEGSTNTYDKRDHWEVYCLR